MKKILPLIIFFYSLVLIQTSLLVPFALFGKLPNLILVSVILFLLLENPRENFGFFVALWGGLLIDIFSSYPFGTVTIFFLFLAFLLKKLSSSLKKMAIIWFSLFSLFALILYNLFSEFAFYLLQSPVLEIGHFQISSGMLISVDLIYNFILLLATFYILHFSKKYV